MTDGKVVDEQVNDVQIMDLPEDNTGLHDELPDDSLVEITMSGKTVSVPKEVADAIEAERQGMSKKLGENAQELGELRKYQRETANRDVVIKDRPDEVKPEYDYEEGIYNDANAAMKHLEEKIVERVTKAYTRDQTSRESSQSFWDKMWRENPDLGSDNIREDAQRRILDELPRYQHLPDNKATRDKMAEDTRQYYLNIAKGFSNGGNNSNSVYSEGASNYQRVENKQEEEPKRRTTAQILKSNRAKKDKALLENK